MAPIRSLIAGAALVATAFADKSVEADRFTYYNLETPLASPCDLYTGPDNNIYVSTFTSDKLVKIDTKSGQLSEITIPYTRDALPLSVLPQSLQGLGACVVQPGGDGNVYLASGVRNELVQYNPKTGKFNMYMNTGGSLGNLQPFNDMWPGDGGMWFTQTTAGVLTFFDFKTTKMTSYPFSLGPLAGPVGTIVVPDGSVYVCEFTGQRLAKFDPVHKTFKEYNVPLTLAGPGVTRAFTDNRYVWFTALLGNAMGRFDTHTETFKTFSNLPNLGIPIEDTADGNQNVWFSTAASNTLNYVSHSTGEIVRVATPDAPFPELPVSLPPAIGIASHWDNCTNSIWFTELAFNRVGRYQLNGNEH